jgi:hypothetical protein
MLRKHLPIDSFADRDMLALFSGGGIGHQAIQARLRPFREDLEAAFGPALNVTEDDPEVDEGLVEEVDSGDEEEDDGGILLEEDLGENSDDDGEEVDDDLDDDSAWGDLADVEENNDILTEEAHYGYDTL